MARYRNQWHNPKDKHTGPEFYETRAEPDHHRGFDVYHRTPLVWDVVSDGTCVGQYAGPNGARKAIDDHLDGTGISYLTFPEEGQVPAPGR